VSRRVRPLDLSRSITITQFAAVVRGSAIALAIWSVAGFAFAQSGAKRDPAPTPAAQSASGSLLDKVSRERRAAVQAIESEVSASLRSARARIATQPAEVYHDLSVELDRVRKSKDLDAPDRARWAAQIRSMMLQASRQASNRSDLTLRSTQDAEAQRLRDITVEQQRAQRALAQTSANIQRQQFDAAVDAAERAQAWGGAPGASAAAATQARMAGRYANNVAQQRSRNDGYLSSTDSIARSSIPISDTPGIQYPSAAEWQAKTAAREKYSNMVDMHRVTPGEAKIEAALKETSSLDCDQMPLTDVVAYLRARHGIEIQLDRKGLTAAAVDTSTLVTMHVKGIKLKSILKLLCDELELASVRRDDILLITTKERAEYFNEIRVYYVGPEVMDPRPVFWGGGWGPGF
jgi:hypothetical protein